MLGSVVGVPEVQPVVQPGTQVLGVQHELKQIQDASNTRTPTYDYVVDEQAVT